MEAQDRVHFHVGDDDRLVLRIQRHSEGLDQYLTRSGKGPAGRDVAIIFMDVPDAHIRRFVVWPRIAAKIKPRGG